MPYLALLEGLVRSMPGARAALMLDAEGEVVVETGERDYRARLIGAYQGIALATARRTAERYLGGEVACLLCRYSQASVILQSLRDGYYLVLALDPTANAGLGLQRAARWGARLAAEL